MSPLVAFLVALGLLFAFTVARKFGFAANVMFAARIAVAVLAFLYWYQDAGSVPAMAEQVWDLFRGLVDWAREQFAGLLDEEPTRIASRRNGGDGS
jgi:hypothetical protein